MKWRKVISVIACFVSVFAWGSARASTLDFEVGLTGGWAKLANLAPNYAGFTWDSQLWVYHEASMAADYGAPSYPSSDEALTLFASPATVTVQTNSPIELNGAWFAAMYPATYGSNYSAKTITIKGYLGASLVGTASATINHYNFTHLQTNFASQIDRFTITGSGGLYNYQYWIMDNLEYVPEPATAILLILAFAGAAGRVTGRRRAITHPGGR